MTRCLACQREFKAKRERERRRNDPEYRKRCNDGVREQRKAKGHIYNQTRYKVLKAKRMALKESA